MIWIGENEVGEDEVVLRVEGVLDRKSVSILQDTCNRYLESDKKIFLHLSGLLDISRQGVAFLENAPTRIVLVDIPRFVTLHPSSSSRQGRKRGRPGSQRGSKPRRENECG